MEILSLAGGALSGFIFKMLAQNAQNRADEHKMLIERIGSRDSSADKASTRVPNSKEGNWIRRILVLSILFGVILAPFILAVFGKPVIVEVSSPVKSWFFGLFSSGGKQHFYELSSYLLIQEVRVALMSLIGFYFGQSAARTS